MVVVRICIRIMIEAIVVTAITVPAALAQTVVTGADLLVDLDQYVGKEVILTDAEVFGAHNDRALVKSRGADFWIDVQGIDRETFRHFLKNCSGAVPPPGQCTHRLLVTGKRE